MNIVSDIRKANAHRRDAPAVTEGARSVTYGQLLHGVTEYRTLLQNHGIGPGTIAAFRCSDGSDYIIVSLALLECGAAMVPVDMTIPPGEVNSLVDRMGAEVLISEKAESEPENGDVSLKGGGCSKEFLLRRTASSAAAPERIKKLKPAFIRFSSGTTGASKGVVLTHRTILERTDAANTALNIDENDRVLWVLSMSHHFVVSILLFLRKGATIIIGHHRFPGSVIETAAGGRITFIYASPLHYHLLAASEKLPAEALKNVRLAISTAMKLHPDTSEAFANRFGIYPGEAYGIIEVGLPFIDLMPSRTSCGSVGKILPAYRMRLDKTGGPESDIGEVLIKGKGMFDAYMSPFRPSREVLEDGWFRTGDLAQVDAEQNLRLVGRSKLVIICAGMKVFPEEVEEVLNAHPDVKESLIYGAPHPVYGQVPEAKIVPASKGIEEKDLRGPLRRHCYARLPSYCVPKHFKLVSSLAKTPSGKVKRH